MNREIHVRFWESAGVRFPCATHQSELQTSDLTLASDDHLARIKRDSRRFGVLNRPGTAAAHYQSHAQMKAAHGDAL
jgi:hypothetical protein